MKSGPATGPHRSRPRTPTSSRIVLSSTSTSPPPVDTADHYGATDYTTSDESAVGDVALTIPAETTQPTPQPSSRRKRRKSRCRRRRRARLRTPDTLRPLKATEAGVGGAGGAGGVDRGGGVDEAGPAVPSCFRRPPHPAGHHVEAGAHHRQLTGKLIGCCGSLTHSVTRPEDHRHTLAAARCRHCTGKPPGITLPPQRCRRGHAVWNHTASPATPDRARRPPSARTHPTATNPPTHPRRTAFEFVAPAERPRKPRSLRFRPLSPTSDGHFTVVAFSGGRRPEGGEKSMRPPVLPSPHPRPPRARRQAGPRPRTTPTSTVASTVSGARPPRSHSSACSASAETTMPSASARKRRFRRPHLTDRERRTGGAVSAPRHRCRSHPSTAV